MKFNDIFFEKHLKPFLDEDDYFRNLNYILALPKKNVMCHLKIKDDLTLSGLGVFFKVFEMLGANASVDALEYEGKSFKKADKEIIEFELPFNIALSGERLALNLLQRMSSISTLTARFVEKAKPFGIEILDTRKTTPGLRAFEKYAVQIAGGKNHRFGQADMWMIKDNHKSYFGGLKQAYEFFKKVNTFYTPILAEIHDFSELEEAYRLGIKHVMLDNFSPEQIKEVTKSKPNGVTFEISGGINLENIDSYLLNGVDAISIGALTHSVRQVDLSLKMSTL